MCGILGAPSLDGSPAFDSALERLRSRGQDGAGSITLAGPRPFRLACQRLAITDQSATQPILHGVAPERLAVVCNGSFKDHAGWRERVTLAGSPCVSANDAELPLRVYQSMGIEGLRRLEGQFAFALFEEATGRLILGRDAFGEKPLYLWEETGQEGGLPRFASSLAALRAMDEGRFGDELRVEPQDLATWFAYGWIDAEDSCFALPFRSFPRGRIRVYEPCGKVEEHALLEASAASVERSSFGELLVSAVEKRSRSDRPLCLFLSGGLDSAALAIAAKEAGLRPLCLSLDFEGGTSESERARRVAKLLDLPHESFTVGPRVLHAIPDLARAAGYPIGDSSVLAVHALACHAKRLGCGVVLSGEGGDELFLGYRRQRAHAWVALAQSLLPGSWRRGLAYFARSQSTAARFLRALESAHPYAEFWRTVTDRGIQESLGIDCEARPPSPFPSSLSAREQDLRAYLAWDLCPKLDVATLLAGIEGRSPFLDAPLLAYARLRVHGTKERSGKHVLREYLARYLPSELREGRKLGFALPLARWLGMGRDSQLATLEYRRRIFAAAFPGEARRIEQRMHEDPKRSAQASMREGRR